MESLEKAYSTKEISTILDIGDSTLRKWAASLEKNGYMFVKNEHNHRLFVERDIIVFIQFKKLIKEANMPLDSASKLMIKRLEEESFSTRTEVAPSLERRSNERMDTINEKILNHIHKQESFNQKLIDVIQQQSEEITTLKLYIDRKIESRDQQLMTALRESQEVKQLFLEKQKGQKNKKGFFSKLFSR